MGAFSCDSSPGKKISGAGDSDQIAPAKEGVSIFFGRSSIETVKNLAVKRWNSIPKQFQEDVSKTPSPGSVARKAAFFDHYIRTVSLEKEAVSSDQEPMPQPEEDEEHVKQEEGEEEEGEEGEENEEEEEEDKEEKEGGAVDCSNDPEERMDQVEGEEEQESLASALATQMDVPCPMESAIYFQQQTAMNSNEEEVDEDSTVFSAKPTDLSTAIEKMILKGGSGVKNDATAPASVLAAASQNKKTKPGRASAPGQHVTNKWKSKQGLIPGVRAAQVTSKTTTEQLTGKKSGASSRVARAKNESAVPPPPPKDKEKSTRSNGSGSANGFTFRSNQRAEQRKEFNRRMEEKQSAKEAEKTKIQAKTQEEMQAKIKELRRGLNFKATPMPGFYQEQPSTKTDVRKANPRAPKSQPHSDHPIQQQQHHLSKSKSTAAGAPSKRQEVGRSSSSAIAVS